LCCSYGSSSGSLSFCGNAFLEIGGVTCD
jgi:hypothetical protein